MKSAAVDLEMMLVSTEHDIEDTVAYILIPRATRTAKKSASSRVGAQIWDLTCEEAWWRG